MYTQCIVTRTPTIFSNGWLVGVVDITGQIITTRLRAVCGVMRDVRVFLALEELMG